jgi:hypothetical protein
MPRNYRKSGSKSVRCPLYPRKRIFAAFAEKAPWI